jgi:hypothetical protein
MMDSQLQPCIVQFAQLNYELDLTQYKVYEINDPWVETFIQRMQDTVVIYREYLNEEIWEELIMYLVDALIGNLEQILLKKTYTYYGGLQLHNDIQQLFKYFTILTKRTVRDKFTRLIQITSLLTLEKVTEILDYWYIENMKWRLTCDEVKEILKRRKDFNCVAIDRLKLSGDNVK